MTILAKNKPLCWLRQLTVLVFLTAVVAVGPVVLSGCSGAQRGAPVEEVTTRMTADDEAALSGEEQAPQTSVAGPDEESDEGPDAESVAGPDDGSDDN